METTMPPNVLKSSQGGDSHDITSSSSCGHRRPSDPIYCDRDSITVMTRSPSPLDDNLGTPTDSYVQVIMEDLTNNSNGGIPMMSAGNPSDHQPPSSQRLRSSVGSRIAARSLRKKSSNLIKSFTGAGGPSSRVNSLVSSQSGVESIDECGNSSIGLSGHGSLSGSSVGLDQLLGELATSDRDGSGPGNDDATSVSEDETDVASSQLDISLPRNRNPGGGDRGKGLAKNKKWQPRKTSSRIKSNLLKSFTGKGSSGMGSKSGGKASDYTNHSSHPTAGHRGSRLSGLAEEPLRRNSDHDECLSEQLRQQSGDALNSTRDIARMLQADTADCYSDDSNEGDLFEGDEVRGNPKLLTNQHSRQSSIASNFSSTESDPYIDELDNGLLLDSRAMLESLGDSPTSRDLANVAAIRASEYIEEFLSADVAQSVLDRKKWDAIPQFAKSDLVVGQHLGKGSFSDAFEVFVTVVEEETRMTFESFESDRKDLDKLIEMKFSQKNIMGGGVGEIRNLSEGDEDGGELDDEIDAMFAEQNKNKGEEDTKEDLDSEIDAMFGKKDDKEEEGEDLDSEIDAMFGKKDDKEDSAGDLDSEIDAMFGKNDNKEDSAGDLDGEIDAMFGTLNVGKSYTPKAKKQSTKAVETRSESDDFVPQQLSGMRQRNSDAFVPQQLNVPKRNGRRQRRITHDLGSSVCLGTIQSEGKSRKPKERKLVLAMKCLRPQIRSNADQFIIGVEDLVHETAMLASLEHPNIVKIHGKAGGCLSNSFRLSDGFFILLDRLQDTLDDRIVRWKKSNKDKRAPPTLTQVKAAASIADAMSFLHSKNIVFRDLKPANVGFDSSGTLKMFDFGFAIGVDDPDEEYDGLLYDKCGTPRYMAPEVGLEKGYSIPVDLYSFGILLWEICSLTKPYKNIRSADEFHKTVFEKGARPKLAKYWPEVLKEIIVKCWDEDPEVRPEMSYVKSMLAAHARELSIQQRNGGAQKKNSLRNSLVFRRFTG